jgi:hypothetical protein
MSCLCWLAAVKKLMTVAHQHSHHLECVLGTHTCKPFSELCHNTIGSFVCNCSNGYIKKDKGCAIVSDCDKSIECGANAFCKMRPSKENPDKLVPECVCQDGYYGINPKEFCDAVPDCEKDNQCSSNSKCVQTQIKDRNGRATFTCACAIGYRKLGSQCAPIHGNKFGALSSEESNQQDSKN